MKILVVQYDNGYAVTLTEKVERPRPNGDPDKVEVQQKRVFENRDQMFAFLQERL